MLKRAQILFVFIFVFNICSNSYVYGAEYSNIISVYEDTYTSSEYLLKSYCFDEQLKVSKTEKAYVLFYIDKKISVYDSVMLRLTPSEGSGKLSVCSLVSNSVSLQDLNGKTQKPYGNAIATAELEKNKQNSVDLTDFINKNKDLRGYIGFAFTVSDDSDLSFVFPSRESGSSNAVYLEILKNNKLPQEVKPTDEKNFNNIDGEYVVDKGLLVKKSDLKVQKPEVPTLPQFPELKEYNDIDSLTTTRYKPWLVNYHMTEPVQIGLNYKGGDCGQMCVSFAVCPKNPNRLLLGTDTECIWRSEDGGVTWQPSADGLLLSAVPCIIFDPDNENIAYALSSSMKDAAREEAKAYCGIYKSEDGGKSWRQVANFPNIFTKVLKCFAFGDADKDGKRNIYCISWLGGLYRSCDGGENWELMGLKEYNMRQMEVSGDTIVIATSKGILKSIDGGKTFEKANKGIVNNDIRAILINPEDRSNWFSIDNQYLYESKDCGESWETINNFDGIRNGFGNVSPSGSMLVDMKFSAPDSTGKRLLYIGTGYMHYIVRCSADYGKTFSPDVVINNEIGYMESNWGWNIEAIVPHPLNRDIMWTLFDDEVYKTIDGGKTYFPSASGYSGHRAVDFEFNPKDPNDIMFAFTDRGLAQTIPSGMGEQYPAASNVASEDKFWIRYNNAKSASSIARDPKNPKRYLMFIGPWNMTILKESLDGGLSWKAVSDEIVAPAVQFMAFNHSNPNTIYAGDFISYDDGKTWSKSAYRIREVSPLNGNVVYASTKVSIMKSSNEGRAWEELYTGTGISDKYLNCDLFKEDKLYFGTFLEGIQIYEDGKLKKINAKNGLSMGKFGGMGYYQVAQDPKDPLHLVTCSNDAWYNSRAPGIFESFDGGESWRNVEGMQCAADAWRVEWHPTLPRVYIGTSGGTYVYEYEKYYDMSEKIYLDTEQSYAKKEIDKLFEGKISNQFHDGYFRPKDSFTRAEIISMINNILPISCIKTDQIFSDITIRSREFVNTRKAYEAGLIVKSNDGMFRPYDNITYQDLVVLFARILNYKNVGADFDMSMLSSMPSDLSEYAKYSYAICSKLKIIDEKVDFKATADAIREDVAYMLCKLIDLI